MNDVLLLYDCLNSRDHVILFKFVPFYPRNNFNSEGMFKCEMSVNLLCHLITWYVSYSTHDLFVLIFNAIGRKWLIDLGSSFDGSFLLPTAYVSWENIEVILVIVVGGVM